jgi:hypothetical protein
MASTAIAPLQMSVSELDELFASSPAGPVPAGRGAGTALALPGSRWSAPLARVTGALWRGKVFNPIRHELLNLLTPLDFRAFRAAVREEPRLLDGRPCIVLDYSKTSIVAHWVRDEIRQVGPNDYLGIVFVRGRQVPLRFWLSFTPVA